MALREQIIRTAKEWIQAHNERDAAGQARVAALTTTDFIARTFPASLQVPNRNREEYAAFQSWSTNLFDSYQATETDMVVDETQCKVIYYIDSQGKTSAGEYKNQYIHKLILTEDGKLVKQFDIFMDSQAMEAWMGKVQTQPGS